MGAMTAEREWPMYEPQGDVRAGGFWRGLAGAVSAGLMLLAIALFALTAFAPEFGVRGPGGVVLAGHVVAAVFAVAAAVLADRTRGLLAFIGVVGALTIATITLWWFWLS
ncbi:hypothetical protein [Haloechinothrix halophila]|uniref:hypothetical protein n=1 Tax=Haloechinothrix halophila TaxID=1069073 RepID=UPI00040C8213|nr:hypothetical protein [Haloechinothrix halophila]